MSEDELRKIGEFLEMHAFAHRTVEYCDYWTYEEKMILDLYNNYLNLLDQQKEFIEWLENEIRECNGYSKYVKKKVKELKPRRLGKTYLTVQMMKNEAEKECYEKILSKYKEIIGNKYEEN